MYAVDAGTDYTIVDRRVSVGIIFVTLGGRCHLPGHSKLSRMEAAACRIE